MTKELGALSVLTCFALATATLPLVGVDTASPSPVLLAQAGTPAKPSSAQSLPMSVLWAQADSQRKTVTFAIQNTGTKVITAWDVVIVVGTEPEARYGGYGVDAFRGFAGLVPGRSHIPPNGTVTVTADLPSGSEGLVPVVVMPNSAVFADTSFAGDPKSAEFVFERRREQLEAWREIVQQLEAASQAQTLDVEPLELMLANVNASMQRNGVDIVRSTFRANLSIAIGNIRAGRTQVAPALSRLLQEARQNVAVATAHSRR